MEIGDVLERIMEPFSKEVVDPKGEADLILNETSAWVADSLAKEPSKLEKQPFVLTPEEIDVIQTSLAEIKSKEILGKRRYKKRAKQKVGVELSNLFNQKYDEIAQKLVKPKDLEAASGISEALEKYFGFIKNFAPEFVYQQSTLEELIGICNQISGKRPAILIVKQPAKVNN